MSNEKIRRVADFLINTLKPVWRQKAVVATIVQ